MAAETRSKSVLVTGASRGIGRAVALQLAERGARVGIHFRESRSLAEEVLAALPGTGHALFQADTSSPSEIERLWGEARAHFGEVDVVVNNAGAHAEHPPLTSTYEAWNAAWERIIAVNLRGPANLSYLAGRAMAKRGSGRIVNISSRGAFRGEPESPGYGASKAGLNSLSQSLAKALAPSGVLVFCIAPGWVETEMAAGILAGPRGDEIRSQQPLGWITTAAEIAATVVFCALEAPASMTGSIVDVNGASYLRT